LRPKRIKVVKILCTNYLYNIITTILQNRQIQLVFMFPHPRVLA